MNLYVFGRPEDTVFYSEMQENVIAAISEEQAWHVLKQTKRYDEDAVLKHVFVIDELYAGQIIL